MAKWVEETKEPNEWKGRKEGGNERNVSHRNGYLRHRPRSPEASGATHSPTSNITTSTHMNCAGLKHGSSRSHIFEQGESAYRLDFQRSGGYPTVTSAPFTMATPPHVFKPHGEYDSPSLVTTGLLTICLLVDNG